MIRWSIGLVCLVVGGLAGAVLTGPMLQGQAPGVPATPKEMTSYREVVKQVLPAVVSIEARAKQAPKSKQPSTPRRRPGGDDLFPFPEEFRRFFDNPEQRQFELPEELPQGGFGSGFLIDPKGIILTNYHVVAGADTVEVELRDGRKFTSKDIKGDRLNDLAIVRLNTSEALPYLQLGDSDAMEIGDRVLAAGAPFGLTGSVTAGIVSGKGRNGLNNSRSVYEDYLQTDAAINPGNSGGPLVNLEGKVIGINTAIKSRSGGFQGVGLAIASNLAKNIVQQLIRDGTVQRGYIGLQVAELTSDVANQLGLKEHEGVVVSRVFEGSPADKAGLQDGDVVTTLDGKPVKDGRELQRIVGTLALKKPVDVTVVRDGKPKRLAVTIAQMPDNYGVVREASTTLRPREDNDEVTVDKLGLGIADLTPELASRYGFKESATGVLVTEVEASSVAAQAGLRRGMLLLRVDKKPITSAKALRQSMEKASLDKGLLLFVQYPQNQGGGTAYLVLKAEAVK
jgi:serine protease Do